MSFYFRYGKRMLDLVLGVPLLVGLSPFLAFIALAIKVDSRGPIFFTQDRPTQGGRPFWALKFRTMTDKFREKHVEVLAGNPEVTRIGAFLRRYKLDELPQLWNVLTGDMSLVGPRPGLLSQVAEYDENGKKRLLVKGGITGLAQVSGGIHLSWPERWRLDAEYVDRVSLALDVRILAKTVLVVLLGEERFARSRGAGHSA